MDMHASAKAAWYAFIKQDEGEVAFMYLDTKGLVTTGIGNLIDPVGEALPLPFQFRAGNARNAVPGQLATRIEIDAEWKFLKNHPNRATFIRGGHRAIEPYTSLELSASNRQRLFEDKSNSNERQLRHVFADFDRWPADAQLGLMAMAWGLGPRFPVRWPKFFHACRSQDFDGAAAESRISTWRIERNNASLRLFGNAARVVRNPGFFEPTTLYFPRLLVDAVSVRA
jgi:hypothetical protein